MRRGYHTLRLETGNLQLAAIALYTSAGYTEVQPYGHYFSENPQCVTYEKRLDVGMTSRPTRSTAARSPYDRCCSITRSTPASARSPSVLDRLGGGPSSGTSPRK